MNVLVTRPDERGEQLVEMLAQKQIFAIHQPLLKMENGEELPLLPTILSHLKAGDYVFAVSKNAIDFSANALSHTGFIWRDDLLYFAVGQRSANYFCSIIERPVRYPTISENSEGLLALPEMNAVEGKKIVILRADSGREIFSETITARGAEVQAVTCYNRIKISDELNAKLELAKRAGIDTIVVTSCEILQTLVEEINSEDCPWLFSCRLIVVGKRVATIAQELGWDSRLIAISERADNVSLLECLLKGHKS